MAEILGQKPLNFHHEFSGQKPLIQPDSKTFQKHAN